MCTSCFEAFASELSRLAVTPRRISLHFEAKTPSFVQLNWDTFNFNPLTSAVGEILTGDTLRGCFWVCFSYPSWFVVLVFGSALICFASDLSLCSPFQSHDTLGLFSRVCFSCLSWFPVSVWFSFFVSAG